MAGRNRRRKGGSLFGLLALIFLIYMLSNYGWIFAVIFAFGMVALLFFIIRAIAREVKKNEPAKKDPVNVKTQGTYPRQEARPADVKPAPEKKKEPTYSPAVQSVILEGKRAHGELEHLYATIPALSVKAKIRELIDVSDKIIEDAKSDPADVPQIKKFLDYYLPTTIKLLNAYDRMGSQGIDGQNINATMQSIEEMLDTAIAAYKKLLDSLFANQALDVETDIEVMNTLLKREGWTDNSFGVSSVNGAAKTQNAQNTTQQYKEQEK